MKPRPLMRCILLTVAALLLSACGGNAVVMVATPVPPDASFRMYRHPTGVFSLRLPADWAVRDVSQGNVIQVEFSASGSGGLPLTVRVVNTGTVLTATALLDAIETYQAVINPDPARYTEISRAAQGDGSWRLSGVRQTPIGPRQLNTFIQADGAFLSAIEADLTDLDGRSMELLRAVINTFRIDSAAVIAAGNLAVEGGDSAQTTGVIAFSSIHTWTSQSGDFVINGRVTNEAATALEAVRITALLSDASGAKLVEATNVVPLEVLTPGQSAPFSVRFRGGRPPAAVRYELDAAARDAEYALGAHLGDSRFIRGNERAFYNASNLFSVVGDVVNATDAGAYYVKAVVTVFDETGNVVAVDSVFLDKSTLLPGEVSRFEITFAELGGSAIRYDVSIEGKNTP